MPPTRLPVVWDMGGKRQRKAIVIDNRYFAFHLPCVWLLLRTPCPPLLTSEGAPWFSVRFPIERLFCSSGWRGWVESSWFALHMTHSCR